MSVIVSVAGKVKEVDELRYLPSGTAVLSWTFVKNVGTKDAPNFNWFKASLFGTQAESLSGKIVKDTRFFITGKQKARMYQKKDGTTGLALEISVSDFEFTGDSPQAEKKQEEDTETIPF